MGSLPLIFINFKMVVLHFLLLTGLGDINTISSTTPGTGNKKEISIVSYESLFSLENMWQMTLICTRFY